MKTLPDNAPEWWSADYVSEHAYLVERGVRPLAIVGHVEDGEVSMLEAASRLEIASVHMRVVPFVVRRLDGFADCGFAAAAWVVDLYEWLVSSGDVPPEHAHRIRGLLLGYDVASVRAHDDRTCGRRFTQSPARASK